MSPREWGAVPGESGDSGLSGKTCANSEFTYGNSGQDNTGRFDKIWRGEEDHRGAMVQDI